MHEIGWRVNQLEGGYKFYRNDIQKKLINKIVICKNSRDIKVSINDNKIAIILHIEGAEAISENFCGVFRLFNIIWTANTCAI